MNETWENRVRADRLYHAVWLALAAGVLIASAALATDNRSQVVLPVVRWPLPPLCGMQRVVGLPCPGCGLTRCFIALAHGDVRAGWSYNPAGLALFPLVALQVPLRTWQLWRLRRGLPEVALGMATPLVIGGVAAALFTQWVLRLMGVQF
jgi:hypothetical protein